MSNQIDKDEMTTTQYSELLRLKSYFPYRIVFGVLDPSTGVFDAYCKTTMHTANKMLRKGCKVWVLK